MQNLWNVEDQRLLEQLNKEILSGTTLAIPDTFKRFHIKTYWSRDGMGAVLLQAYISAQAKKSEAQENDGGKCGFDKSLEVMLL